MDAQYVDKYGFPLFGAAILLIIIKQYLWPIVTKRMENAERRADEAEKMLRLLLTNSNADLQKICTEFTAVWNKEVKNVENLVAEFKRISGHKIKK